MSERAASPAGARWQRRLLGPWAAGVILAAFWIFMLASLRDKSLVFDEVAHATAGYSYWHFGEYRLQPENGQLPQRVAGLGLLTATRRAPATDTDAWRDADIWNLGFQWIYQQVNDPEKMAAAGRRACGLLAVALGALVWLWSSRLFGPAGGMLSLLLYVLNPTILANGALMTSDMAAALFFAGSMGALWQLMQRITIARLALSTGMVAGLMVSKMSAMLIGPMALLLVVARLADGRPLPVALGLPRELARRSQQALALAMVAAIHVLVVVAVVWGVYGFRFAAVSEPRENETRFEKPWEFVLDKPGPGKLLKQLTLTDSQEQRTAQIFQAHHLNAQLWLFPAVDAMDEIRRTVLTPEQQLRLDELRAAPAPTLTGRGLEFLRRHELLPEAWIYGLAYVVRRSQWRSAFINGDFSAVGWMSFFPYTFMVKTPLEVFGVMGLAVAAVMAGWRRAGEVRPSESRLRWLWSGAYQTLPLWVLLLVYWAVAIGSHLNIGHRHLLPVYAPMFVLCGMAGAWIKTWPTRETYNRRPVAGGARRVAAGALLGLMSLLAAEVLWRFPNYLAYFNGVVSPAHAYRHLVDSSLDWGQDLPAARRYIDARPEAGPYYLSYFGLADPGYHGIRARPFYSYPGMHSQGTPPLEILPLPPGPVEETVAALQQERPEYDFLAVNRSPEKILSMWLKKPAELRLAGGTYLISASMLQPVYYGLEEPGRPWNERHEAAYQQLYAAVKPLLGDDAGARAAALSRHPFDEWAWVLLHFEQYRFARLATGLLQREPDDEINFSILVYHLTDADIGRALDGPPPEAGPDRTKKMPGPQARGKN